MLTYHLIIKGKVQGVFYRDSARKEALKLGLSGWIRNMPDGSVEAMASGEEDQLLAFVTWCKDGPPLAKVTEVIQRLAEPQAFNSFSIKR